MIETSGFLLPNTREPYKALLVGFEENAMAECGRLLDTLEVAVVDAQCVTIRNIQAGTYLGKGKLEELCALKITHKANLVIVDAELTPKQLQNIETALDGCPVLDRAGIILEIFSRHARTREAKTQVELARLTYLLPRLAHYWTHFERQKGGIGLKGMGEKQIEVDRRLLRKRM